MKAWLKKRDDNLIKKLSENYRLKAFRFDRTDGATELADQPDADPSAGRSSGQDAIDPARWAGQLSTDGKVTALGQALEDLASRQSSGHLAGLLVVSDFDQNSGTPAVAAAQKVGVPVFTLGVGAEAAVDLAVDLQTPLLLKKSEKTTLTATLRSHGLKGANANVRLSARPILDGSTDVDGPDPIVIDERPVSLESDEQAVEFTWTPADTGRFVVTAAAEPLPGELVTQNNKAEREINIRDDFLRLMFVEFEPTWEWRFIKEVFHRDKLVGMQGFRTFLGSSDPRVRENNVLFLSTLTPKRSEFFANDVIFLLGVK